MEESQLQQMLQIVSVAVAAAFLQQQKQASESPSSLKIDRKEFSG